MSFRTDAVPAEVVGLLTRSPRLLQAFPDAYLAEGTALSLHLAHRLSVDLDFFVARGFGAEDVRRNLIAAGRFEPIAVRDDSVVCLVDDVKWSLFRYEYPLLAPMDSYEGVPVASIRDIAAMKLAAVGDRGSRKDFYDLYAILQMKQFGIRAIVEDLLLKYQLSGDAQYHFIKALTYFDDAVKAPDIQETLRFNVRWPEVEAFFIRTARGLI